MTTTKWLIAEYCDHEFLYTGWHLYLRDSASPDQRNADGEWGWIRRPKESSAGDLLKQLGCEITGDGTLDRDGVGQFARKYTLGNTIIGGKPRGGVEVTVDHLDYDRISLASGVRQ